MSSILGPTPSDVGQFVIGQSPIGTEPKLNFEYTIISQYGNSPTLWQMIQNFQQYIDPTQSLDFFYDNIWNIDTAVGYGLDVWGRILGVTRLINIPGATLGPYWGFSQASDAQPFDQAPFFNGSNTANVQTVALPDSNYRQLLLAKALANISDGSIKGVNAILRFLFPGRGNCYVQDNLNMSLVYVFKFPLTVSEQAIIVQSGVLPRPCGVSTTFTHL